MPVMRRGKCAFARGKASDVSNESPPGAFGDTASGSVRQVSAKGGIALDNVAPPPAPEDFF